MTSGGNGCWEVTELTVKERQETSGRLAVAEEWQEEAVTVEWRKRRTQPRMKTTE